MVAPTEIAEAIVAALITAMGLVALALGAARRKSGDRSALRELRVWTGGEVELQDDVTVVVVDAGPPRL